MIVTGRTRLYGIVADPIYHVKTPQAFNRLLEQQDVDGIMVPLHVNTTGLNDALQAIRALKNFGGLIVTVPHKTGIVARCDELVGDAALVGAVNAVRREPDGRLVGAILDGAGFVKGLRSQGIEPKGMRAYVAGAGGAGSAIVFALAAAGISHLTIANRSIARARELGERVAGAYPKLVISTDASDVAGSDLIVNATTLGMGEGDRLPLDADLLHSRQIVAEAIMEPAMTPLLHAAQANGCRIHAGMHMLEAQVEMMARHLGALP